MRQSENLWRSHWHKKHFEVSKNAVDVHLVPRHACICLYDVNIIVFAYVQYVVNVNVVRAATPSQIDLLAKIYATFIDQQSNQKDRERVCLSTTINSTDSTSTAYTRSDETDMQRFR